jgi:hypothetical protein
VRSKRLSDVFVANAVTRKTATRIGETVGLPLPRKPGSTKHEIKSRDASVAYKSDVAVHTTRTSAQQSVNRICDCELVLCYRFLLYAAPFSYQRLGLHPVENSIAVEIDVPQQGIGLIVIAGQKPAYEVVRIQNNRH